MINSKTFIGFSIPYITIVCSLYQLIYYGLFGLNGLVFVSVGNIIKSAAYPMLLTFLFASFGAFIGHRLINLLKKPKHNDNSKITISEVPVKFLFLLLFNSIFVALVYFIFGELNYVLIAFAIGNAFCGVIDFDMLINNDIGKYIDKEFLVMLLVYLPLFSGATAFQNALNIRDNRSYKYSTVNNNSDCTTILKVDTIKLIGMTEERFIFTDINNEKIYFIKSDTMVLHTK